MPLVGRATLCEFLAVPRSVGFVALALLVAVPIAVPARAAPPPRPRYALDATYDADAHSREARSIPRSRLAAARNPCQRATDSRRVDL